MEKIDVIQFENTTHSNLLFSREYEMALVLVGSDLEREELKKKQSSEI